MSTPRFPADPVLRLLRVGDVDAFHKNIEEREVVDFTGADLRGTDFRKVDLGKLILRDAYLRDTDFRGCDLRHLDLEGVSLQNAKVGGAYFPDKVAATELRMSLRHGTRIRTSQT
jgi:uncharacterized protein YjbI with pentapeptide repeats